MGGGGTNLFNFEKNILGQKLIDLINTRTFNTSFNAT